jgi:hypothetical protein
MKKTVTPTDKVYRLKSESAPLALMIATRSSRRQPLLWYDEEKNENRVLRYAKNQRSPFDALIAARELDLEQIEAVSRVLFGSKSSITTTAELKRDLLIYAKQDPFGFLDILQDSSLQLRSKVQSFFDAGLLTFRKNNTEVWYNTVSNKKKMLSVPFGDEPMDSVTSYLQTDEGIEALKMLESKM